MDEFPFTQEDWQKLSEACRVLTNAALAEDPVLQASASLEFSALVEELRSTYGEHPALREVEADFAEDHMLRLDLYSRARDLARANGLSTLSIRLSLARELLDGVGDAIAARAELKACESELSAVGDGDDLTEWLSIWEECKRRIAAEADN